MRVDNRVAERRPQHNEPVEREHHRTQADATGVRHGHLPAGNSTRADTRGRSGIRSGTRHGHTLRFPWSGLPGTRQSSRWRWCEGEAR